jgi:hypothetical protein
VSKRVLLLLFFLFVSFVQAQIVIPTFGVRGDVPQDIVQSFMQVFRGAVAERTGFTVSNGELVTQGIAGSLEPNFAYFIAELEGTRYAVLGEIRLLEPNRYAIGLLVADGDEERSSDLLDEPFDSSSLVTVAVSLAAEVQRFTAPMAGLEAGSAGLFISSQPNEATVFINGNEVGETGSLEVIALQPGSYHLELRKEGFLPEVRRVDLKDGVTELVNIPLTPIAGGSLQVLSTPNAQVFVDDRPVGVSPLTVQALPGTRVVRLERPGFESVTREVQVRDYRVTRIEEPLTPSFERMVFWDISGTALLTIDGVLQSSSYAELAPGQHTFDLRQGGQQHNFVITMPAQGVFRVDFVGGRLEPFLP